MFWDIYLLDDHDHPVSPTRRVSLSAPDNTHHSSSHTPSTTTPGTNNVTGTSTTTGAVGAVDAGSGAISGNGNGNGTSPPSPDQFASKRAAHYNEFKLIQAMRAKQQLMDEEDEEDEYEEDG